ncbi:membrane protease YdiL (CAAX protease family) [Breznakia sp. PF5-3]|uniref:CPBP family intramembrane glutamic endopeptidase n=1 Tax=unclassified Breznakia TaxID=2623764 RepID=UPI002404F210|nr:MULTISPECIES: type II CAAX endopeptidase family protein [unclassified Breznakia]MDF9825889.1 membrane protease YdiL (CAAX protease family) [Breznakia sp. PM6-1]MDF9836686.1 membrane protease YdiL (CAAX protease family) [Breznakia sp. PF5-3]MDF9838962.1 membrane protease YdiL (CAAX protease family) [Breznakia sp. PFB2-8]MDF9860980.1 membrane protease YdiL (CAAX protease family) [Breznakia sp. PH5-24]
MGKYKEYVLGQKRRIGVLIAYFILWLFIIPIIVLGFMNLFNVEDKLLYVFFDYLLGSILVVAIAFPLFKKEADINFIDLIKAIATGIGLLLLANIIIGNFIGILFSLETSENQNQIMQIQRMNPYIYLITVGVLAPILEETVFRGVIFRMVREKSSFFKAALISSFFFGFIHVMDSIFIGKFMDLIYIFLYGAMGIVFAKAYEDTGSIYGCIILHGLYNTLAFVLSTM